MKVGLAGLGWAAQAFHLPALQSVPGAVVVGGADPSAEQRAAWTKGTGTPAFETLDELLAETGAEAVVIATPPDSHADLSITALEGGAHVLCEKPFVETVEQADRVLAAAAAAGRQVAINHQYRDKPIFRAVKERVGSQDVGRLVFCQIEQLMDLAPWDEPVAWRAAMPNRTLFEGGVHLVDLMVDLFGELPEAVYARHSSGLETGARRRRDPPRDARVPGQPPRADHDRPALQGGHALHRAPCRLRARLAARVARRADHAPGRDQASGAAGHPPPLRPRRRGLGRARHAQKDDRAEPARIRGSSRRRRSSGESSPPSSEGVEPPSTGREARGVLSVIEAAYRSAETGERVVLAAAA